MTLVLATIPDDTAHLSRWLEERIVSGEVGALAAELAAVHNAQLPRESVRERLGHLLDDVLHRGLSLLPPEHLRHLLRQPYHLLELQEVVLLEGGPYWDTVEQPAEFVAAVRENRERVTADLFAPFAEPADEPRPRRGTDRRGILGAVVATAATVFVATFAATRYLPPTRPTGAWGWAKAGAFPADLDRAAYLNRLADEADEWFAQRPADPAATAKRIVEFRQGCTALLAADHPPLSPADRTWLRERCKIWGRAIDDYLAALKDTGDADTALTATDGTVRQLSKALRDRAAAG